MFAARIFIVATQNIVRISFPVLRGHLIDKISKVWLSDEVGEGEVEIMKKN